MLVISRRWYARRGSQILDMAGTSMLCSSSSESRLVLLRARKQGQITAREATDYSLPGRTP